MRTVIIPAYAAQPGDRVVGDCSAAGCHVERDVPEPLDNARSSFWQAVYAVAHDEQHRKHHGVADIADQITYAPIGSEVLPNEWDQPTPDPLPEDTKAIERAHDARAWTGHTSKANAQVLIWGWTGALVWALFLGLGYHYFGWAW